MIVRRSVCWLESCREKGNSTFQRDDINHCNEYEMDSRRFWNVFRLLIHKGMCLSSLPLLSSFRGNSFSSNAPRQQELIPKMTIALSTGTEKPLPHSWFRLTRGEPPDDRNSPFICSTENSIFGSSFMIMVVWRVAIGLFFFFTFHTCTPSVKSVPGIPIVAAAVIAVLCDYISHHFIHRSVNITQQTLTAVSAHSPDACIARTEWEQIAGTFVRFHIHNNSDSSEPISKRKPMEEPRGEEKNKRDAFLGFPFVVDEFQVHGSNIILLVELQWLLLWRWLWWWWRWCFSCMWVICVVEHNKKKKNETKPISINFLLDITSNDFDFESNNPLHAHVNVCVWLSMCTILTHASVYLPGKGLKANESLSQSKWKTQVL